jgi:serine/threonine protein kinase
MPHHSEKDKKFNLSEIGFLAFCNHPNIVSYFDSYLNDTEIWVNNIVSTFWLTMTSVSWNSCKEEHWIKQ